MRSRVALLRGQVRKARVSRAHASRRKRQGGELELQDGAGRSHCDVSRRRLAPLVFVFALAACASAQSPLGSPGAANGAVIPPTRGASWMAPQAQKAASLLYVSNWGTSDVTVYTYANGGGLVLIGTLTGFSLPGGLCA